MGKISLDRLPQAINNRDYLYADLYLDLEDSYNINNNLFQKNEINDFKLDYDIDAIRNSLVNLFTTAPGEKILNPEYGLDLRKYLFSPATIEVAESIREHIYIQIARFEPRIVLTDVRILIYEDVNEFDITISFNIPYLNITNFTLFGSLNNNGFVFTR